MWRNELLSTYQGSLYKKVAYLIEYYIEQGVLVAGERLPSERVLAVSLNINRSTAIHALDELTERGILVRKPGSGTYVNGDKWGLQTYPTINWHLPTKLNRSQTLYQTKVQQFKQHAEQSKQLICDLSNGDLPINLMPKLSLPIMTSQELIQQEKTIEASLFGLSSLKKHIADYMQQQFAMSVSTDEILITSGIQQSLFLITQGLLKPGDAIGIEAPSYFYSLPLFQAAGLRIYAIPTDEEGIQLEGLKRIIAQQRLKWIFLNPIFQNPTGRSMSTARKKALLDFCQKEYIAIVEDDAYSALYFDEQLDCTPIKKYDHCGQVIYLGSLSKYIGRSIRVGWMIAPAQIITKLAEIRQYVDSGLSILPQLLAEDYLLNHYQNHQQLLRTVLQEKSHRMMAWLQQHYRDKVFYHQPKGGFHLYAKLTMSNEQQEYEWLNQLLLHNIVVTRGADFGDPFGHIRLSYAHFDENLIR